MYNGIYIKIFGYIFSSVTWGQCYIDFPHKYRGIVSRGAATLVIQSILTPAPQEQSIQSTRFKLGNNKHGYRCLLGVK